MSTSLGPRERMPSLRVSAAAREALRKSRAPNMMCNRVPLYCLPHVLRVLLKLLLFGVLFGRVARTCATCRAACEPDARGRKGPAPVHVLVQARDASEPRRFGNPSSALLVLRDAGITVARIAATDWNPDQKDMARSRQSRADALRGAHEAAAYNQWLAAEAKAAMTTRHEPDALA